MHTCPECGNHDMAPRRLDGATVFECGLCGAQFGDRRAVDELAYEDVAARSGVPAGMWPLVRALGTLDGFESGSVSAGDATRALYIELIVTSPAALVQVENIAKTLRLAAGGLRCHWRLEARFEQALVFVLTTAAADSRRDALIDVEALAGHFERNPRLSWWRRPAPPDERR